MKRLFLFLLLLAVWGLPACQTRQAPTQALGPAIASTGSSTGIPDSAPGDQAKVDQALQKLTAPVQAEPSAAAVSGFAQDKPVTASPASEQDLDIQNGNTAREIEFYFPEAEIVFSPAAVDFDIQAYLKETNGALLTHQEYLESTGWTGASDILARVAIENSINPRLLLGVLEYQCGCVLGASEDVLDSGYALGVQDYRRKGLYGQLWWAANQLSTGYYGWKEGWLKEFSLPDGTLVRPQPETDAGWVALQYYFSQLWSAHDKSTIMGAQAWAELHPDAFDAQDWQKALDPEQGFLEHYETMFASELAAAMQAGANIPPDLEQPTFNLPFEPGKLWTLSSGPHQPWEAKGSLAALDFAPASDFPGCTRSSAWVVAVADGPLVRLGSGLVIQDLAVTEPADGLEQTGWAIMYMHISSLDMAPLGAYLQAGDRIGHPSCEGGPATGTHLHIARKYNGEWIAAGGRIPFVMDGWAARAGQQPYQGSLIKDGSVVIARPNGSRDTHITRPESTPAPQNLNPEIKEP